MQFEKIDGRTGWQTPLGVPLVDGILASLCGKGDGDDPEEGGGEKGGENGAEGKVVVRETVVASNPGFSAVPNAFSRALPSSAVIGVGVNDPQVGNMTTVYWSYIFMYSDTSKSYLKFVYVTFLWRRFAREYTYCY